MAQAQQPKILAQPSQIVIIKPDQTMMEILLAYIQHASELTPEERSTILPIIKEMSTPTRFNSEG